MSWSCIQSTHLRFLRWRDRGKIEIDCPFVPSSERHQAMQERSLFSFELVGEHFSSFAGCYLFLSFYSAKHHHCHFKGKKQSIPNNVTQVTKQMNRCSLQIAFDPLTLCSSMLQISVNSLTWLKHKYFLGKFWSNCNSLLDWDGLPESILNNTVDMSAFWWILLDQSTEVLSMKQYQKPLSVNKPSISDNLNNVTETLRP